MLILFDKNKKGANVNFIIFPARITFTKIEINS